MPRQIQPVLPPAHLSVLPPAPSYGRGSTKASCGPQRQHSRLLHPLRHQQQHHRRSLLLVVGMMFWPDGFYDVWHGCWYRHGCGPIALWMLSWAHVRQRSFIVRRVPLLHLQQPASQRVNFSRSSWCSAWSLPAMRLHASPTWMHWRLASRDSEETAWVIRALAVESALEILLPRRRAWELLSYFESHEYLGTISWPDKPHRDRKAERKGSSCI